MNAHLRGDVVPGKGAWTEAGETVRLPVTVVITTRNEEANLEKCLKSIHGFVEQIVVIDSESTDRTLEIARRYTDDIHVLAYVHDRIIPWIFQWALDNVPMRGEWILILEADQVIPPALREELAELLRRPDVRENGFFIRRQQVFRGRTLRFGGYGSKYLLKLFRHGSGRLDAREEDTRVYVDGCLGRLQNPLLEENLKETEILFYLGKHLRYADAFAKEEYQRRSHGMGWKTTPSFFGTPDQRTLWLKSVYYRLPLYWRAALYFVYRYVIRLGFLDGKEGTIFHFLQAFWFRLVVDLRLEELMRASCVADPSRPRRGSTPEAGGEP